MELKELEASFNKNIFETEDDVKIHFHTDIIKPLLHHLNPNLANQYKSENVLLAGGRTDATFQNILFELKKINHFSSKKGIEEALFGRNEHDHGLYDYIISNSKITATDSENVIVNKIVQGIGVGFDGKMFIFARFVISNKYESIRSNKLKLQIPDELKVHFTYEVKNFQNGLRKLVLLLKQQDKMALNKQNLISMINPKSQFVRNSIKAIYNELIFNINDLSGSNRVRTLYNEWNKVFGIMYGEDEEATDFTEVSSVIKDIYGYSEEEIDSKIYLFALQTFFNIFLKLLIHSFLAQLITPTFSAKTTLTKAEIDKLFDGEFNKDNSLVNNFFESHFMEWFTYTDSGFEQNIINETLEIIDMFDLSTFILKPEEVQDILQEIYMELIPTEMRHLMGEYFSPDWIVEHALDMVGYNGDPTKSLIDPTAGSGTFLTHAIKRIIANSENKTLNKADIINITKKIVGFDINPISVVAAKANYILILFSACSEDVFESFGDPISVPLYIADSILAPVVYTEENHETLSVKTSVKDFIIPKFENYDDASEFLRQLSKSIHEKADFDRFWNRVNAGLNLVSDKYKDIVSSLFDDLYILHRAGKDSFWPIILKNSFAPILIGNKFDYVVGNPPWIAWKSMSKSYREGTLEIWKSYGIFEKNAYDKKTTHDDFGMAVTYVAIDKYLKENGNMVFLLPASFLKSTKGGEGFRKFSITRNKQDIPFAVERVDDFSNVNLFTIPTIVIKFIKNRMMKYPINKYYTWFQNGRKVKIDSHTKWLDAITKLTKYQKMAQPVDSSDLQSAWLTMSDMSFANCVLDPTSKRYYKGRKGIEPAGAKGVYILKKPQKTMDGLLKIENDISRQRRKDIIAKGINKGKIEETFIFPMLGGRNIEKWRVKSNEFLLVPHTKEYKYGIPEKELEKIAPRTIEWLDFYHDELLASRIQNGKFFNPEIQPYYRLDNIGEYTYAPYKVLWKEQTGSMSAVVVSTYLKTIPNSDDSIFKDDKIIVVDSKVLMLGLDLEDEAYFVCGILNAASIVDVIDSYAISTNRGTDVLKYLAIPKYSEEIQLHKDIAKISKQIHLIFRSDKILSNDIKELETNLDEIVRKLFVK